MNFRTSWDIAPFETQLKHGDKIVLMGSCFSENIGKKLQYFGFDALVNPFGTIFHPLPLAAVLEPSSFGEIRTIERDDYWYTFEAHSAIQATDEGELLDKLFEQQALLKSYLKEAKMLVITFGSAWGYYKDNAIVANCHKLPASNFDKSLTDLHSMVHQWRKLIRDLKEIYPQLNIVFTVSPVRHTKDGMVENQQSKARLIELVHHLNENYFPAYEIQMDDLRDYRFYEADLIHPNSMAVDYIFGKFSEVAIAEQTRKHFPSIQKFRMFESHQIKPWDETRAAKHTLEIAKKRVQLLNQIPNLSL